MDYVPSTAMQVPKYLHGSGARDAHGLPTRTAGHHPHERRSTAKQTPNNFVSMADKSNEYDFIPTWDGDPSTFLVYAKRARRYVETTRKSERYLCGPRLESRLTGRAEAATERCRGGWLSDDQGVERLLAYLQAKVGRQAEPDAGARLTNFFFKVRGGGARRCRPGA